MIPLGLGQSGHEVIGGMYGEDTVGEMKTPRSR